MIYFTADLHLGHEKIIQLTNRPFESVEEMDTALISKWNAKVKKSDTVYIIGDLIYKSQSPEKYLKQLNGKKILVRGNHDEGWLGLIDADKYFLGITSLLEVSLFNRMVTMCHYPMLEWRNSRKDGKKLGYLIHGHIHNRNDAKYDVLFNAPNALNAGVDINNYEPVTFEELIENNTEYKK